MLQQEVHLGQSAFVDRFWLSSAFSLSKPAIYRRHGALANLGHLLVGNVPAVVEVLGRHAKGAASVKPHQFQFPLSQIAGMLHSTRLR